MRTLGLKALAITIIALMPAAPQAADIHRTTTISAETRASLNLLENALSTRLSKMTPKSALEVSYRLYQFNVKMRNRVFRKTEDEIQAHLTDIKNGVISINRNPDEEEIELTGEWTAVEGLGEIKETQASRMGSDIQELRKEKLLQTADRVLVSLGSILQTDGTLSTASLKTFEQKLKIYQSKFSTKAILPLSVLSVGLGVVGLPFVVLAVSSWSTSLSALWWVQIVTLDPFSKIK